MFYLTGDTKGNFKRVERFCYEMSTTKKDVLILLGDSCIKLGCTEEYILEFLSKLPITIFCINNYVQCRSAEDIVDKQIWNNGIVLIERKYPDLLFARSGEIYNFDNQSVLVAGVRECVFSKFLGRQCTEDKSLYSVKRKTVQNLRQYQNRVNVILSPVCPIDCNSKKVQTKEYSSIDRLTRQWLYKIEKMVHYNEWYCGFHTAKTIGKINCMSENFDVLVNDFLED